MVQTINAITPLSEARAILAQHFDLKFSKAIERATDKIFDRVRHQIPEIEWSYYAPLIFQINKLKAEKDAVILAHNYQTPQIYHGVADVVGDSLQLAIEATKVRQQVIVQCGVHFMAETSKLLNPTKTVLIPDSRAGCSLSESITAEDVMAMRANYPGVPVVTYVNTSAAVKAVTDVCCTSSNALDIVNRVEGDTVIMIPDQYLAANVARQTGVEVITHPGACEVHERFTPSDIHQLRSDYPGVTVLAHPECPPAVVDEADYAGSTAQMVDYVGTRRPRRIALITECSMSDNVAQQFPDTEFVRPCNLCPHMKRNTLARIRHSLETMTHRVTIDEAVAERARAAVDRMLAVGSK